MSNPIRTILALSLLFLGCSDPESSSNSQTRLDTGAVDDLGAVDAPTLDSQPDTSDDPVAELGPDTTDDVVSDQAYYVGGPLSA